MPFLVWGQGIWLQVMAQSLAGLCPGPRLDSGDWLCTSFSRHPPYRTTLQDSLTEGPTHLYRGSSQEASEQPSLLFAQGQLL